jgi:hypothetical protein
VQNKVKRGGRIRLIKRRERWGLTLWGWLAAFIVAVIILLSGVSGIHGFLAGYDFGYDVARGGAQGARESKLWGGGLKQAVPRFSPGI